MNWVSKTVMLFRGACVRLAPLVALFALPSLMLASDLIPLRAGPVSMAFDLDNILLRYVKVGDQEILRAISAPVRDQNWATVAPNISNLRVVKQTDGFLLTFDVICKEGDIDFRWKGSISGTNKGVIEYSFDGEAHSTFKRNRIGFCVLHGPTAAGKPWVIETADGKTSKGKFPQFISPRQPAKNLKAITHEVAPGIRARVDLGGEIFEMEDQRNWTDASFKTYCTPLEIPYPVEIPKGTKVSQKIKISVEGDIQQIKPTEIGGVVLTLGQKESPLPRIGLQVSREVQNLSQQQIERLKALNLDHLRVDLSLSEKSFVNELRRATNQAKELGVSLHVGLNLGPSPDFATLLDEIKTIQPPVSFWLVIGTDKGQLVRTKKELSPVADDAKIGLTEITNFVELNRARPDEKSTGPVGFAINPQVHAFDYLSLMETLPIHADVVNSARQFSGNRPLVIGPITLRPQLINGKVQPGGPPPGPFPIYLDVRQGTRFNALWTLGSLKFLGEAGAHSATYFETVGWNGIMDAEDVKSRPAGWPSSPGLLFPVYHLLKDIGEFSGGQIRQVDCSNNLVATAIAVVKSGKTRILVANLTEKEQTVTLRGFSGKNAGDQIRDGANQQQAAEKIFQLQPFGIVKIEN